MHGSIVLTVSFGCAAQAQFIGECREMIKETETIYRSNPALMPEVLAFLRTPAPVQTKLNSYMVSGGVCADPAREATPEERQALRDLLTGVVVFERLHQSRKWLDHFGAFRGLLTAEAMEAFPSLNVKREIGRDLYTALLAGAHDPYTGYALMWSDRLFTTVKPKDKELRAAALE